LERFAYIASHDLQEPLRMVASYTQLLARRYGEKLDEDAHEFIAFAVDGANRMQQLINDLLAYSRVGTHDLTFERVDLNEVLKSVQRDLGGLIEDQRAVVTSGQLPRVWADAHQIQQLLQNLIANAIKFHKPGEPPRVELSAERREGAWQIAVRDHGIGIEAQYSERIFIVFQRLHSIGEYPGTGIGLAICKKIVERHRGRIWVDSTPGEGTTFLFTIPLKSEEG
jgi:light-regulated signal transduction histidine kinase (bacteriophytochrome)